MAILLATEYMYTLKSNKLLLLLLLYEYLIFPCTSHNDERLFNQQIALHCSNYVRLVNSILFQMLFWTPYSWKLLVKIRAVAPYYIMAFLCYLGKINKIFSFENPNLSSIISYISNWSNNNSKPRKRSENDNFFSSNHISTRYWEVRK